MSGFHRFKEYLKYLFKAKTPHGVHSPFVYDFVENVLRDQSEGPARVSIDAPDKKLVDKIISHFHCRNVLSIENTPAEYSRADLLIIDLTNSSEWLAAFEKCCPLLSSDSIVLINSIHSNRLNTEMWKKMQLKPEVTLSIDLYKMGLLFFRKEFKEKQHFVLKYL